MTVECARRERDKSYAFESWTNDDDGEARTAITWPQVALKAFKPLSLSTALCLSLHFPQELSDDKKRSEALSPVRNWDIS